MAVTCWLTANVSTWASAGSAIYYYDETEPVEEDRIKPYNSLPKSGDTFYMNGYNNTQASSYTVNIPNGIIRNDLNPYTGRTGGQATGTGNNGTVNYICKEIHVGDTVFHVQGSNGSATINVTGDVYCEGTAAFFYKSGNGVLYLRVTGNVYRGPSAALTTAYSDRGGNIVINGNYYGYGVISTAGMNGSVVINGNVEMFASRLCGQTHSFVAIYGNVKLHNNAYLSSYAQTDVSIYGNITLEGQDLFTVKATTVSFYGDKITYSNFDPLKTLFFTDNLSVYSEQLEIERTDDYGESVLISKYQLDNTDQYPAEEDVRKDIPYAYGLLEGTYLPDYPQQSTVLDGVTYDNGNLEGTLQISTPPSTSDIVTAIKNDSDLGGKITSTDTNVSDVKSRLGSVNSGTIGSVVDTINTNTQSLSTDLAVVDGNVDTLISRITQNLVDRLGSSVTVQLLQQILDAHLND